LLVLALTPTARAGELPVPVRALYGLDRRAPPFRGLSPTEVVRWLREHHFNAVFGGARDGPLSAALAQAGIRRYAEVALFVGERHWRRHPESRPLGPDGRPHAKRGWYAGVCPSQEWLVEAKLREVERLLGSGRVDGIWLDFIRFPGRWEGRAPTLPQSCFCPTCLRALAAAGIGPTEGEPDARAQAILSRERERFVAWKCARIASVVRRFRERMRAVRPTALLGIFTVPYRRSDRGDPGRAVLGQDARLLGPLVDVVSPMAYHLMLGRPPAWIGELTRTLRAEAGKPIVPVVQACSVPVRLDDEAFLAATRAAVAPPSAGVIVFSQRHFVRERRGEAWRRAFAPAVR
jgi:hypothetical protein